MGTYLGLLMSFLKWTTAITVGSATLVGLGLYAFQSHIIYPASIPSGSRTLVDGPEKFGMPEYDDLYLTTSDGERLHCFSIMQTKEFARRRPTILLFHANAGNMGHRLPIAKVFHQNMGFNVFMLSYRGYGKSTGVPSETGMKIDAQRALQFILDHEVLKETNLFAYGQSIGGAVAIDIVHRNQARFAGLIVENTFLSIRSLIPSVMPFASPLARFCHQFWNSEALIDTLELPVLFLSGLKDEIVPAHQMARLYELCGSSQKVWRAYPNGTHNDTVAQEGYMEAIYHFIDGIVSTSAKR